MVSVFDLLCRACVLSPVQMMGFTGKGRWVSKVVTRTPICNTAVVITPDGKEVVVSNCGSHELSVYSLPDGGHLRTFGGRGGGTGQFNCPSMLCWSPTGNILVAEFDNMRIQEVKLTGEHVRFIGVGVIDEAISGIACNGKLVAVTKESGILRNGRVMLFDYATGSLVRALGDYGDAPGQLGKCRGIRFHPNGEHIVVCEGDNDRVSSFTLAGGYVSSFAAYGPGDIDFTSTGEYVVLQDCDIGVYSAEGVLLRSWGCDGKADGEFRVPAGLAVHGNKLYVVESDSARVQVFV